MKPSQRDIKGIIQSIILFVLWAWAVVAVVAFTFWLMYIER